MNNTLNNTRFSSNSQVLAEIAIFVALSTALSLIVVYTMPQGGSITAASMVPLIWLALRRGPKIGVAAGILYGLIQFVLLPYIADPLQILLDYPLAFGVLGVAGFFKRWPVIGAAVGISLRFVLHFIAGVISWAPIYAPDLNPYVYSAVYNGSYLLPELIISGFVLYLLQKSNVLNAYL
ncbi:MAG: energy-coupled thiamine transporter ThiT [Candidatus Bathyarchaeota archaeon]|nr:energy-coupled thiamine transporter ThiT [Candidatus Bathyarchaeota archaeon]